MRTDNLLLVAICTVAVLAAAAIAWRGRRLPVVAPRPVPTDASSAAFDALLLLAAFGVSDPLSPDNVDFVILSPLRLAVALVCLTTLLFGVTFSALVAWLDATLVPLNELRSDVPRRYKLANLSLIWLLVPSRLASSAPSTSSDEPSRMAAWRRPSTAQRSASPDTHSWRSAPSQPPAPCSAP